MKIHLMCQNLSFKLLFACLLILFTNEINGQTVEIQGSLKVNVLGQENEADEILVKKADGTMGLRELSSFPSSIPSSGIILSNTADNMELINAGFVEIGKQESQFSDREMGTWSATSPIDAPSGRSGHSAIWTGSDMIVWGGTDGTNTYNNGGIYKDLTGVWITFQGNAPIARKDHSATWTGSEMIVYGGKDEGDKAIGSGSRYSVITEDWTPISVANFLNDRFYHAALWTGSELIIWGGIDHSDIYFDDGALYDPNTNTWSSMSSVNAPSARVYHTYVWTGTEMIVWGGISNGSLTNTGAKYNPSTNVWTTISSINAPDPRYLHTAIWTGEKMIVWGGVDINSFNTGGVYDPVSDSWTSTSTVQAPPERYFHSAVWTGNEMIIWGGVVNNSSDYGKLYDPLTDRWKTIDDSSEPIDRLKFSTVWTGSEMIIWGGTENGTTFLDSGGKLDPSVLGAYNPSQVVEFYLYMKQ